LDLNDVILLYFTHLLFGISLDLVAHAWLSSQPHIKKA
jgi:hypothetical protein